MPSPGVDEPPLEVGKTPFGWGGAFGNGLVPLYGGRFPLETDGALFGADGTFFEVARAYFRGCFAFRVRGALRSVGFGVGALGSVRFVWASRYTD